MLGLLPHSGRSCSIKKRSRPSSSTSGLRRTEIRYWFPFPITVRECVSLGLYPIFLSSSEKVKKISKSGKCLETCQSSWSSRSPDRPAFGRAIPTGANRPLLGPRSRGHLLDDPCRIDSVSEDIIMQTLRTLKQEGKTILIVHHDLSKVPTYFDQVLLLHRKLIAFGKTEKPLPRRICMQPMGMNSL